MQRAYLEGLEADGTIKLQDSSEDGFPAEGEGGPRVRKGVDAGTDVIDITAMRAELEGKRGGVR